MIYKKLKLNIGLGDKKGFAFPSIEDWNEIKWLLNDWTQNLMKWIITLYIETPMICMIKEN